MTHNLLNLDDFFRQAGAWGTRGFPSRSLGTRNQTNLGFSLRLPLIIFLILSLLILGGCAEVTKPTPTAPQIEAAQLATARRHPYQSWYWERASRVFLRLMPWLPVTQGRTYPFLGFNWWVTATGQAVVDQVWYPSPAREAGLRRGDVIVAVNNWSLPTWVEAVSYTHLTLPTIYSV